MNTGKLSVESWNSFGRMAYPLNQRSVNSRRLPSSTLVVVSHNSVKMDLAKVAGVSEWPTPSNKEVQSFLGFTNFYQRFIEGFSHIAQPLFDLTKADSGFKWSSEEKLVFDTLKDGITSTPILALPDNSKPYCVKADSLDFATGAVLSQQNLEDRKWHPVTFLSKSLSPVERNYEIHDKEMLAIIWSLEEWKTSLRSGWTTKTWSISCLPRN